MKHRLTLLTSLLFALWALPSLAQDSATPAASVYNVGDVAVDVTADSAAKARDLAIAQAQRNAFSQLLERLGAEASAGTKLSDNDLSTLVQNFEVRNERASAVRYIGTFAVQFRPTAVRNYLGSKHASFSDAQGKPVLVIPILKNGTQTSLWEQPNAWQKAWSDTAHDGGIVPVIVPTGSPEDKSALSTADAVAGKTSAIKSLMEKYKTDSAFIVTINGALDAPTPAGYTVDVQHFGTNFDDGSDVQHINLASTGDKSAVDGILTQGVKTIRKKIEKDAKDEPNHGAASLTTPPPAPEQVWTDEAAPSKISVTVQFNTLAEWADIQRRLTASQGVRRIDVISVNRGATEIELGFAGKPEDIQMSVAQHNLRLTQDILSGEWVLKGF